MKLVVPLVLHVIGYNGDNYNRMTATLIKSNIKIKCFVNYFNVLQCYVKQLAPLAIDFLNLQSVSFNDMANYILETQQKLTKSIYSSI